MKKETILLGFLILSIIFFSSYILAQETNDAGVVLDGSTSTIIEEGNSKFCSYTWDPTDYFGKDVEITAKITSLGKSVSDSIQIRVVDENVDVIEDISLQSEGDLSIKINKPLGEKVTTGRATNIIISINSLDELEPISLVFSTDDSKKKIIISDKNCADTYNKIANTCERYYLCGDGKEVQYCELVKTYNGNQEASGTGCVCRSIPEQLCSAQDYRGLNEAGVPNNRIDSTTGEELSGNNTEIVETEYEGVEQNSNKEESGNTLNTETNRTGESTTQIICDGCIVEDKCVPVGYRINNKYCEITKELTDQLDAGESCNNNFECSTNLCIDSKCISSNLWQKFVSLFEKLFG